MAEEGGDPEPVVQAQDPQYQLEQHVKFRRKQQVLNQVFTKLLTENVKDLKPIMNGKGYAFTTLKIRNTGLREVTEAIKNYEHLRNIDFSSNLLKQIPNLLNIKYLTNLNLSRNLLTSVSFLSREGIFPYLKQILLQGNRIVALQTVAIKSLRKLNLNQNLINTLQDFTGHPVLQILQLRANKLKSLKGLKNVPSLRQLYIAENQLTDLKQIENADNLLKINARKNKIANLNNFPQLPNLIYLNLRQNAIAKVLDLTGIQNTVKNINLIGNPIQAQLADNTKKEVWMRFRNFNRINKNQVTNEQKQQFDKQYKDRLAEQQRERLEKQAAEKQAKQATQQKQS